ncbi:MAG: hypothetical protein CBC48_07000 [bacterium TMED88]|nr:MAG: hypothetical protein CBC48_07000 [bacterium TMED88]
MTTLTYDGDESASGELSAEEQDSLQVGEQMMAEQESLLAGKFQNPEALEQAYLELQSKLGSAANDSEEPTADDQDESIESDTEFLDSLWEQASSDSFTDETLETLSEMNSTDLANMYLEYRNNVEQQSATPELSDEAISSIHESVGGSNEYAAMMNWAKDNLSEQQIEMYDSVMDRGDTASAFFAAQALRFMFNETEGTDGQMLTGNASFDNSESFRSQAELVNAMSDPRYDNDPAYRNDVLKKLDRSDINF